MGFERVMVTGGAGFIGSAFVRHVLTASEAHVLTFDLLTYAGHMENLDGLPGAARHRFVRGDIADPDAVAGVLETFRPDAIVSFAAETHVDRSLIDQARFVRTNVVGTQVLLDAARQVGARYLQVSTDEVYGSLDAPQMATSETRLSPSNPYAASKAGSDLLVLTAHRSHRQDVMVTRCTNNYGPRQSPEKLVPLMILRALKSRSLPVYGDGLHERDWIHVEDHAAGLFAALTRGEAGRVYQFAGRTARANLDVVAGICAEVGADRDLIKHVEDRPGHDRRYSLDDEDTRRSLDWAPRIPFDEGLPRTIAWYRDNEAWCRATASDDMLAFLEANYGHRA